MKKRIIPKILSIVLAITLFAMAPLFLTACGAPTQLNTVAKEAAKDYYKNHVSYENFTNTTYEYEQNSTRKNPVELEYLASAEGTEKTKGTFTNIEELNEVYKFYVVNVGERIAIVIDINAVSTEKTFSVDATYLLKETNEENSRHTIYKLSFVEDGDNITYYLTKEITSKEYGKEATTTKFYREYDEDDYIVAVEKILSSLNKQLIENGYFDIATGEMSMFYSNLITIEGSGANVKAKINYDSFYIYDSQIIDTSMNYEVGFENNKIGKISLSEKMMSDNEYNETTSKLNVKFSVENVNTNIDLNGATKNTSIYVLSYDIPKISFGFYE